MPYKTNRRNCDFVADGEQKREDNNRVVRTRERAAHARRYAVEVKMLDTHHDRPDRKKPITNDSKLEGYVVEFCPRSMKPMERTVAGAAARRKECAVWEARLGEIIEKLKEGGIGEWGKVYRRPGTILPLFVIECSPESARLLRNKLHAEKGMRSSVNKAPKIGLIR